MTLQDGPHQLLRLKKAVTTPTSLVCPTDFSFGSVFWGHVASFLWFRFQSFWSSPLCLLPSSHPAWQVGFPSLSTLTRPLCKPATCLPLTTYFRNLSPDCAVRITFPATNLNILKSVRSLPVITESSWFMIHGGQSSLQSGPYFSVSLHSPPSVSSHSDPVFPESQQVGSVLIVASSEKVLMKLSFKALLDFYAFPFPVEGNQVFI